MRLDERKIHEILSEKGFNTSDFARELMVSRQRASVILNSKEIRFSTALKIAKALDVDVDELCR